MGVPIKMFVAVFTVIINIAWHFYNHDPIGILFSIGATLTFGSLIVAIEREVMLNKINEALQKYELRNHDK